MLPLIRPYKPNRKKVDKYIDSIYERNWFTNNGPLLQELKIRLEEYLGVKNLLLVSNGTLALQVAYRALGVSKQAVTTPYSFVATSSSLVWENIQTVFADINSSSLNLCPIETAKAISSTTQAIVPVHVYGNPCDVDAFAALGNKHNVKVIYDAAHAFGVKLGGKSVLSAGDASTLSFHATKVFHTVEGGAIIFKDSAMYEQAFDIINFGMQYGQTDIDKVGLNAKMSEVHAAFGLAMLDDIEQIISKRTMLLEQYRDLLKDHVTLPVWSAEAEGNGSYCPILLSSESQKEKVLAALNDNSIMARNIFHRPWIKLNFSIRLQRPVQ
jgi:dTDP-4-amino-4,6-dideoxygalactose transaminase